MEKITMCNMKCVALCDKPTENYDQNQFLPAPRGFLLYLQTKLATSITPHLVATEAG